MSELNHLTTPYSYVKIIAALAFRDFCGPLSDLETKDIYEHLSYNEFAFLIGLWLKNRDFSISSFENDPNLLIKKTDELLLELHQAIFFKELNLDITTEESYTKTFTNGTLFKEAFFYSSTGGYDYQYIRWIPEKYKNDHNWLRDERQVELSAISPFFNHLRNRCQEKLKNLGMKENPDFEAILDVFCLSETELISPNFKFKGLLNNLMVDINEPINQQYNDIGDVNCFSEKPIVRLRDSRYFIPLPFFVAEALYESPFYWMNKDKTYRPVAAKNRGDAAEEIVFQQIVRVFGKNNVYKNVIIKKSKGKALTDIDILAINDTDAIIFQIKSKKLTALSKNGNIEAIKDDFTKAVKNAFTQALVSKDALSDTCAYVFEHNGQLLKLAHQQYNSHVVIALLDNYPAISHQTHVLFGMEVEETPVALNIFDLEVLVQYLKTPERFTDYIARRTKFCKYYRAQNEMGFLGYYLEKGLEKLTKYTGIYLDESWAQKIDHEYYSEIVNVKAESVQSSDTIIQAKVGRNEPCPCGSGLKFKKCHGGIL